MMFANILTVPRLARWLSLKDLALVSISHKGCQDAIKAVCDSTQAQQLMLTLETCFPELQLTLDEHGLSTEFVAADKRLQQLWHTVSWLQQTKVLEGRLAALAEAPGLTVDLNQLFAVPQVPSCIADHLVQHVSLRISYQQLLAAAHNRVAGVEVWVQAQQKLGVVTDVPEPYLATYLGNTSQQQLADWEPPAAQDFVNVLLLALNCSNSTCAEQAAATFLPQITDPNLVVQLLLTAVERGHHNVMLVALKQPTVQQLTPAAVWQLMQAASNTAKQKPKEMLFYYTRTGVWMGTLSHGPLQCPSLTTGYSMLHWLIQLPGAAAAVPDPDNLVSLMHAAISKNCEASLVAACSLPAAATIAVQDLLPLIQMAAAGQQASSMEALSTLPAAAHIQVAECYSLLQQAIADGYHWTVEALCKLPAAAHIQVEDCITLLDVALQNNSSLCVGVLCGLPAAKQVGYDWWEKSVRAAIQSRQLNVDALIQLPVSAEASAAVVVEFMKLAIDGKLEYALQRLCALPAAQEMTEKQVLELLKAVIMESQCYGFRNDMHRMFEEVHAMRNLSVDGLLHIIRDLCQKYGDIAYRLLDRDCASLLSWLCNLTAAQQTPKTVLVAEMQAALGGYNAIVAVTAA